MNSCRFTMALLWAVFWCVLPATMEAGEPLNTSPGLMAFEGPVRNSRIGAAPLEIPLHYSYQASKDPLTTEMMWSVDPEQINPHRQRWGLSRKIELEGLRAIRLPNGRFGVKANGIRANARSYMRAQGPWYQRLSDFPCEKVRPHDAQGADWFATPEGARVAVTEAARIWEELLRDRRLKLTYMFERVSGTTPEIALVVAQTVFNNWTRELSQDWRTKGRENVDRLEWQYYWDLAQTEKTCKWPRATVFPVAWERMMEPLPPASTKQILLARAPARRWDALFSVRLNVLVGGKKLNGQFLIDSGARKSVISPTWLENQGVLPGLVEVTGVPPQHVTWGGQWSTERGLARLAMITDADMSGYPVPIKEFLLYDVDFFGPPETVGSCCDGILGIDFLQRATIEFRSVPPAELMVWRSEKFLPEKTGFQWVESAIMSRSEVVSSSCTVHSETQEFKGLRWDTGSDTFLDLHLPWQKAAKTGKNWGLVCNSERLGKDIPVSFPKPETEREFETDRGPLSQKFPAADVGMGFLGRGSFVLDLPHGRVWLAKQSLDVPVRMNRSGLEVQYIFREGERVLIVEKLEKRTPADALFEAGLRPGMILTQVDSKPAEDMDLWEVEQRLAGVYGEMVTVQWNSKKGTSKIVPLRLDF